MKARRIGGKGATEWKRERRDGEAGSPGGRRQRGGLGALFCTPGRKLFSQSVRAAPCLHLPCADVQSLSSPANRPPTIFPIMALEMPPDPRWCAALMLFGLARCFTIISTRAGEACPMIGTRHTVSEEPQSPPARHPASIAT